MYNVSDEYLQKIKSGIIEDKKISGTIKLSSGDIISLDDDILNESSLEINNKCASNSDITIGSCYVGELNLSIYGDYNRYSFLSANDGGIINLTYILGDQNIKLGNYTIYECTKKNSLLSIKAYDNMIKFNKTMSTSYNSTPYNLVKTICKNCGVDFNMTEAEIKTFGNGDLVCNLSSDYFSTYQAALAEICKILGAIGTVDRDGAFVIKKISNTPCISLDYADLITANISDYDVFYSQLIATDKDNKQVLSKKSNNLNGLNYYISSRLITGKDTEKENIVNNIFDNIDNIIYTPADLTLLYNPIFELGDMITIKADGEILKEDVNVIITEYSYKYNGISSLKSVGSNRFLTSNTSDNSNNSIYSDIKNNSTYISTYQSAEDYTVGNTELNIAKIGYGNGAAEVLVINGQCTIDVTTAGTLKIVYYQDNVKSDYYSEEYLTIGKHVLNFNNFFDTSELTNRFIVYKINVISEDGLAGTIQNGLTKAWVLGTMKISGVFEVNNYFEDVMPLFSYSSTESEFQI